MKSGLVFLFRLCILDAGAIAYVVKHRYNHKSDNQHSKKEKDSGQIFYEYLDEKKLERAKENENPIDYQIVFNGKLRRVLVLLFAHYEPFVSSQ